VFGERAETVGKGRVNVGFSYLYADLEKFEGEDFAEFIAQEASNDDLAVAFGFTDGSDFSLQNHVFSFTTSYGITDHWDVGVLLPILSTNLDLDGSSIAESSDPTVNEAVRGLSQVGSFSTFFDDDAAGVGDLLLRTKYRFVEASLAKLAASLALRLPTGDADEFQGLGDVTVTPAVMASSEFKIYEFHAHGGVQFNARDFERTRARYGIGAVVQPWGWGAFLLDVLGSSAFTDDEFTVDLSKNLAAEAGFPLDLVLVPAKFVKTSARVVQFPGFRGGAKVLPANGTIKAFVPRSDLVDISVGAKLKVPGTSTGTLFVNAIMPLTNDGLRADVMPAAGFEYTF
jgi:hypothetical protein